MSREKETIDLVREVAEIISEKNMSCERISVSWHEKSVSESYGDSLTSEILTPHVDIYLVNEDRWRWKYV